MVVCYDSDTLTWSQQYFLGSKWYCRCCNLIGPICMWKQWSSIIINSLFSQSTEAKTLIPQICPKTVLSCFWEWYTFAGLSCQNQNDMLTHKNRAAIVTPYEPSADTPYWTQGIDRHSGHRHVFKVILRAKQITLRVITFSTIVVCGDPCDCDQSMQHNSLMKSPNAL